MNKGFPVAFATLAVTSAVAFACLLPACGGAQKNSDTGESTAEDEGEAQRLLERARQAKDSERYREIILRFGHTNASETARVELAQLLVAESEQKLRTKAWASAEDLADEAKVYGNVATTERARVVLEKVDEGRAADVAEQAAKHAAGGNCASALQLVAAPLRKKPRAHFRHELQKRSQAPLVDCLAKKIEAEVGQGTLEAARSMLETPDATTALTKEGYDLAHAALLKLVVQKSTAAIQPLLSEKKWIEAIAKLDVMLKAGTLSDREYAVAFESVREAMRAHLVTLAKQGVSAAKPTEIERQIDEQVKIAKWKVVPEDLRAERQKLRVAIECEKLRCKTQQGAPAWAWGAITIFPPGDAASGEQGKIKHAQKIWVIAKSKDRVLVATADPGKASGSDVFSKAVGWVDPTRLKSVDTDMWLPPDEQLVGVRVWGPLRPPDPDYQLGVITKVDGKKVSVKRFADNLEQTVDVGVVRIGKLPKGLRVMAFCVDELHPAPAKVDQIVTEEGGLPKVKVNCEKGDKSPIVVAAAVSSKPEWLPKRLP